jgi:hypothetical protein
MEARTKPRKLLTITEPPKTGEKNRFVEDKLT